ncbi:hypothetical protein TSUD_329550 [Trifolium subterraneum]|nr:hypothetical protein TSUD_329550 [Trifolium subterraneum]
MHDSPYKVRRNYYGDVLIDVVTCDLFIWDKGMDHCVNSRDDWNQQEECNKKDVVDVVAFVMELLEYSNKKTNKMKKKLNVESCQENEINVW